MTLIQFHRNNGEVVSNDTPTEPPFQTGPAMIETTIQPTRAAQVTDAAFDAVAAPGGPPTGRWPVGYGQAAGGAEPRLMLMSLPGLGKHTRRTPSFRAWRSFAGE